MSATNDASQSEDSANSLIDCSSAAASTMKRGAPSATSEDDAAPASDAAPDASSASRDAKPPKRRRVELPLPRAAVAPVQRPDHSCRNGRSDSTGRRGVPRGVHRRRGGGYHIVGGARTGEGSRRPPTQESSEREWVGGGGSRPFSSFSVQNIQNTPHGAHLLWCPLRGFFGQNPPKPAKKALNVSRGVQKPAMWSLGRSFG